MGKVLEPKIHGDDLPLMEALLSAGRIKHKYAVRLQAVINKAKGQSTNSIATILGMNINTVSRHVHRYNEGGIAALLYDKTRKPGIEPIPEKVKHKLVQFACQEKPQHQTHWSTRELGKQFGISHTSVNTILRAHDIKPHLVKTFKFSTDKHFESKLADVVGLYLAPPKNSIVFCVDEKSQIQALERTQPILPMGPGIPERQTHDYYRHGTTTLFAALNVASGKVIGKCSKSHKAEDYVTFLQELDRKAPKEKILHIIADNYSSHKAPAVKEYLAEKQGRFVEHFIPTYSSWLNMIERWFAEITTKRIRRESWSSLKELEDAITDYIIHWNESGRKFTWTKTFDDIQKSIEKAKTRLC
jgi:transposase